MRKLAGLPLSAAVCCAFAQTSLPPAVITATREPIALERVVSDLVVIDAARIAQSSADSLEDLLRREAGLQLSRNGPPGQNASVFIRGAASTNTLVLIDGVRVGSATLGFAALEGISLAQIERIEVLRGPGSSLYGADAVGGVVQIVTRRGEGGLRAGARAALGEYDSNEAAASVSGAVRDFDIAASLSREASDGVSAVLPGDRFGLHNPDDDGFIRKTGLLRLGYSPAKGHRIGASLLQARLDSQFDGAVFAPPTFAPDPSPDFRNRLDTRVAALEYRGELSPQWTTTLQAARNDDELASRGGGITDRFETERRQFTWQNALLVAPDRQLVAAFERLIEGAASTSYAGPQSRNNNALVLGYTAKLAAHVLQADARHDRSSVFGGVTTGKLGYRIALPGGFDARAVAGTGYRAPSFNELYFPGFGVASLQPERSRSIEASVGWRAAGSSAGVTLYRNRVRDLIGFEPDAALCPPGYPFGCARNVDRARLQGATIEAQHRPGNFGLRAALDFLDATDAATGQRLTRRAARQGSVTADWQSGALWTSAGVLAVGARPEGGVRVGAYETLDLQARYRLGPRWQLEAKLLNALDRRYQPALDYQALGRQAWIGVRFDQR